jgi:hypothetical protein
VRTTAAGRSLCLQCPLQAILPVLLAEKRSHVQGMQEQLIPTPMSASQADTPWLGLAHVGVWPLDAGTSIHLRWPLRCTWPWVASLCMAHHTAMAYNFSLARLSYTSELLAPCS